MRLALLGLVSAAACGSNRESGEPTPRLGSTPAQEDATVTPRPHGAYLVWDIRRELAIDRARVGDVDVAKLGENGLILEDRKPGAEPTVERYRVLVAMERFRPQIYEVPTGTRKLLLSSRGCGEPGDDGVWVCRGSLTSDMRNASDGVGALDFPSAGVELGRPARLFSVSRGAKLNVFEAIILTPVNVTDEPPADALRALDAASVDLIAKEHEWTMNAKMIE